MLRAEECLPLFSLRLLVFAGGSGTMALLLLLPTLLLPNAACLWWDRWYRWALVSQPAESMCTRFLESSSASLVKKSFHRSFTKQCAFAVIILDIINRAYAQTSCIIKEITILTPRHPWYFPFAESRHLSCKLWYQIQSHKTNAFVFSPLCHLSALPHGAEEQHGGAGSPTGLCSALGHNRGGWWRKQARGPTKCRTGACSMQATKNFPI